MRFLRLCVCLAVMVAAAASLAAPPEASQFYLFVDEEHRPLHGMNGVAVPWLAEEKAKIEQAMAIIHARAPNLLPNATQRGAIRLYKGARAGQERECRAMYNENAISCGPEILKRPAMRHAMAHELAHMVDNRWRPIEVSRSKEFRDQIEPRVERLEAKLKAAGYKSVMDAVRTKDAAKFDMAFAEGLPSAYSAKNITEAFAEYAACLIVPEKVGPNQVYPPVPPEIRTLIRSTILAPLPPPDPARRLYDEALGHVENGDLPRALAALDRTIAVDGAYAAAYHTRGRVLMQVQRWDDAVRDLTVAIRLYGDDEWRTKSLYNLRGQAWSSLQQWSRAAADFNWLVEVDPEDATALGRRGWALFRGGDVERGLQDLTGAIAIRPNEATSYLLRGRVRAAKKDYGGARADLAEFVRLAPNRRAEADATLNAIAREQQRVR